MLRSFFLTALLFSVASAANAQTERKISVLPSETTETAIRNLDKVEKAPLRTRSLSGLKVDLEELEPSDRQRYSTSDAGAVTAPLVVPNTMILQFEPDATEEQIATYLEENDLEIIDTFPKIGAVQVETDLSGYFKPELTDNSANDAVLRGMVAAIMAFQADPLIRSATPDTVLRDQALPMAGALEIANLLTPSDVVLSDPATATESTDWGVEDIEADQLWTMPGANDGVLFGVMDVGFNRHEDLTFLELPSDVDIDDHGNHVAAIACGRHNGRGVRGVLPNCFVRARSADVFFEDNQSGEVLSFIVLFSQILATLERFVDAQDDVHTFNVSLGYNWRSNFGINPDAAESAQWRTLVSSQGTILVSLLELADASGKVIFSAAGNDSTGLADPIDARFASPFNWAALEARDQGIAMNGVVVEAHDDQGNRAPFSNEKGIISCPGVNVFSAVVFDPSGSISRNAYGTMSGTSMASPYCAAGHRLFRMVRPGYSGVEAIDCLLQTGDTSTSGTPMMRLTQALAACPPRI